MSFRKFGTGEVIAQDHVDIGEEDALTESIDGRNAQTGVDLEQAEDEE